MTNALKVYVTPEGAPVMGLPAGTKGTAFERSYSSGPNRLYSVVWEPLTLPADHPTGLMSSDFDLGYMEVE